MGTIRNRISRLYNRFRERNLNEINDSFKLLETNGGIPENKLVKFGDTIIHLGVWRSETIEKWSRLVGKTGKVIIVEADDLNHMINQVEVKRRMLDNVVLVNKGAWNKKEKITLQVSDVSMRNKIKSAQTIDRINPDSNYDQEKVIEGDTIDNILSKLEVTHVDHVFMTISGAELEALEGMKKTIETNDLSIYIRATLLNSNTNKANSERVVDYLTKLGFYVKAAPKEKERDGSNVFAIKKGMIK